MLWFPNLGGFLVVTNSFDESGCGNPSKWSNWPAALLHLHEVLCDLFLVRYSGGTLVVPWSKNGWELRRLHQGFPNMGDPPNHPNLVFFNGKTNGLKMFKVPIFQESATCTQNAGAERRRWRTSLMKPTSGSTSSMSTSYPLLQACCWAIAGSRSTHRKLTLAVEVGLLRKIG